MSGPAPELGTILAVAGSGSTPIEAFHETRARPFRGVSGQPLEVPEGSYWVQAVLPSAFGHGQTTNAQNIEVRAGDVTRIVFDDIDIDPHQQPMPPSPPAPSPPAPSPPPPNPPPLAPSPLAAPTPSPRPLPPQMPAASLSMLAPKSSIAAPLSLVLGAVTGVIGPAAALLRQGWNALQSATPGPTVAQPAAPPDPPEYSLPLCNVDGSSPTMVTADRPFLCVRGARREWLAPIPTIPGEFTAVSTSLPNDPDGPAPFPTLTLRFTDPDLNRLWQFANLRAMTDARTMALALIRASAILPATTAALACYVLLRVEWDERLLHFIGAQLEADADAPDLWAIQAELLSRLGRHDQAAQSLARLGQGRWRWPFFRPGIEYARQRAQGFVAWDGSPGLPAIVPVLSGLTVIAASMNPDPLYLVLRTPDAAATVRTLYPEAFRE